MTSAASRRAGSRRPRADGRVLPAMNRLTSGRTFSEVVRRGRRSGTSRLVVHLRTGTESGGAGPVKVGFIVSKQVGNAVTRNTVKRRLRHLARERVPSLPGSSVLVVRALPAAAAASYTELGDDLDRALSRLADRSPSQRGSE